MEIIYLQAVLMDNGEIICDGKTIGWKNKVGKYLYRPEDDRAKEKIVINPIEG